MEWVALSVALVASLAAGLAHREASRSSSRKQVRTVNEALEELETLQAKLKREWDDERERLVKQARRTGAVARRLEELIEEEPESAPGPESPDAGAGDVPTGDGRRLYAMPESVAPVPRRPWRAGRAG